MRVACLWLLLAVAALALGACGGEKIDARKSERFVRGVVVRQIGVRVRSVRCPENVEIRRNTGFTCLVTGTDGSVGRVSVRQIDDNANIAVNAPFLHMRDVEDSMAGPLGRQVKATVTVRCPEIVTVREQGLFRCRARYDGSTRRVSARMTDETGRFRYRLAARPG
ncbi:MAG: DUF4333 domain-containing protein [Solirubrobacteraceae bacterium]